TWRSNSTRSATDHTPWAASATDTPTCCGRKSHSPFVACHCRADGPHARGESAAPIPPTVHLSDRLGMSCSSSLSRDFFQNRLLEADRDRTGANQGTSRPSCRYNSSTAGYSSCRVTCSHRSRALPWAWQTKQRQRLRPRWAENDRLRG